MQTTVRVKAPSALLVSEDFVRRNRWAAWLKTAGYDTATCAGPHTMRGCPRLKGERCPLREWADLAVVDAPRDAGFEQDVGWVEKPCTTLPDDGRTVFASHGFPLADLAPGRFTVDHPVGTDELLALARGASGRI
jgi:hypothetical protein